jgi:hypothetical protein
MPREATVELLYLPLSAEVSPEAKKAIPGWEKVGYDAAQPFEPILFRVYIPKVTVKKLNATFTIFIEDVTGAAQIIGEATAEGITAAGNTGPVLVERRFVPGKDATVEPEVSQLRKLTVSAEASAETFTIPANTAKCVAYLQILGLGRQ